MFDLTQLFKVLERPEEVNSVLAKIWHFPPYFQQQVQFQVSSVYNDQLSKNSSLKSVAEKTFLFMVELVSSVANSMPMAQNGCMYQQNTHPFYTAQITDCMSSNIAPEKLQSPLSRPYQTSTETPHSCQNIQYITDSNLRIALATESFEKWRMSVISAFGVRWTGFPDVLVKARRFALDRAIDQMRTEIPAKMGDRENLDWSKIPHPPDTMLDSIAEDVGNEIFRGTGVQFNQYAQRQCTSKNLVSESVARMCGTLAENKMAGNARDVNEIPRLFQKAQEHLMENAQSYLSEPKPVFTHHQNTQVTAISSEKRVPQTRDYKNGIMNSRPLLKVHNDLNESNSTPMKIASHPISTNPVNIDKNILLAPQEIQKRVERAKRFLLKREPGTPEESCDKQIIDDLWVEDRIGDSFITIKACRITSRVVPIIGRSTEIEKRYYRLTGPPDPDEVRPIAVLEKTMEFLASKWKGEEVISEDTIRPEEGTDLVGCYHHSYFTRKNKNIWEYLQSQLKSVRQDLIVQNIHSTFTCYVYETNARWALEMGDLGQFNQCQTQIQHLHVKVNPSAFASHIVQDFCPDSPEKYPRPSRETICEFICYRLLYYTLQDLRIDQTKLLKRICQSPRCIRFHPYIMFAKDTRKLILENEYTRCFGIMNSTPTPDVDFQSEIANVSSTSSRVTIPPLASTLLRLFKQFLVMKALCAITRSFVYYPIEAILNLINPFDRENALCILKEAGLIYKVENIDCRSSNHVVCSHKSLVGKNESSMG